MNMCLFSALSVHLESVAPPKNGSKSAFFEQRNKIEPNETTSFSSAHPGPLPGVPGRGGKPNAMGMGGEGLPTASFETAGGLSIISGTLL
jgi:hypothetical protein